MPRAVIAGAGIAGLTAALALNRIGWEAEIAERAPAPAEVGAGIQISPNAARVLRWLGVLDGVAARAHVPTAGVLRDGRTGQVIYRAALGPEAETRWGAPYLHVHRADLLDALLAAVAAAGIPVRTGAEVHAAEGRTDAIALRLADGTEIEGDLALAADGIRSRLRRAIHPDEAPRFSGLYAWRALIPAASLPDGVVGREATVWAGTGRHLVTYRVRGGDTVNLVAVTETPEAAPESWDQTADPDLLRLGFVGWHADVTAILEAVGPCFVTGLHDRPEQARWTRGRLALIGDAAHAMLPFMAQGAAQAMEDAAHLAGALATGAPVAEALESWEHRRWNRVARIQRTSRANGRLYHRAPGPRRSAERLAIGQVSRHLPGLAASRLDWLYGHDPVPQGV